MADQVEQAEIRGLDIDKVVKGYADPNYVFKAVCNISPTSGDSVRWYQETAGDLTATTPMAVANKAIMALPVHLDESWTRNTSYIQEFMAEGAISEMDIMSADIDVFARTSIRIARAVIKQVDTLIWNTLTENQTYQANIQTVSSLGWAGAGTDIVGEIESAKLALFTYNYNPMGARLFINPVTNKNLMKWIITSKGSSIPQFSSEKIASGVIMNLLGCDVVVSPNINASGAALVVPQVACTWKTHTPITTRVIEEPGLQKKVRVWERGIALLTDPKAVVYLSGV